MNRRAQWIGLTIGNRPIIFDMVMDKVEIAIHRGYRIDKHGNVFNPLGKKIKGSLDNRGYKISYFTDHFCALQGLLIEW